MFARGGNSRRCSETKPHARKRPDRPPTVQVRLNENTPERRKIYRKRIRISRDAEGENGEQRFVTLRKKKRNDEKEGGERQYNPECAAVLLTRWGNKAREKTGGQNGKGVK